MPLGINGVNAMLEGLLRVDKAFQEGGKLLERHLKGLTKEWNVGHTMVIAAPSSQDIHAKQWATMLSALACFEQHKCDRTDNEIEYRFVSTTPFYRGGKARLIVWPSSHVSIGNSSHSLHCWLCCSTA